MCAVITRPHIPLIILLHHIIHLVTCHLSLTYSSSDIQMSSSSSYAVMISWFK